MSPGLIAWPDGHVLGRARRRSSSLHRQPEPGDRARSPRSPRRRRDMSNFISCIFAAGLIEMPPVSNVTALPTSAEQRAAASGRS